MHEVLQGGHAEVQCVDEVLCEFANAQVGVGTHRATHGQELASHDFEKGALEEISNNGIMKKRRQ